MPKLEAAQIEELKKKHGPLHELKVEDNSIVVRLPTSGEFRRFRAGAAESKTKGNAALENMLRGCIVAPEPSVVDALFEKLPGLVLTFGEDLMELAGVTDRSEKKEL